jgi:hypothetical protein
LFQDAGHGFLADAMVADLEEARSQAGLTDLGRNSFSGFESAVERWANVDEWDSGQSLGWDSWWGAEESAS